MEDITCNHSNPRKALAIGYLTFIKPVIEYDNVLYDSCNKELRDLIDNIQLEVAHSVTGAKDRSSREALHRELGWMPLTERTQIHKLSKIYAIHNNQALSYLRETLKSYETHIYIHPNYLNYPIPKEELYKKSFFISAINK